MVLRKCREIRLQDIITLGGAVGCRDPKLILEDLRGRLPHERPAIIFNDLAVSMVLKARDIVLKPFTDSGYHLTCLPGEIQQVCRKITPKPRRLIIGIYDSRSFFRAHPNSEHWTCGFEEYVEHAAILGDQFLMDWVTETHAHELVSCGIHALVDCTGAKEDRTRVKHMLRSIQHEVMAGRLKSVTALQVIGRTEGRNGFFISHWYTPIGMRRMIRAAFPAKEFTVSVFHFAKGSVFVIDPRRVKLTGVVTMLNNVLGNVLPQDQFKTLLAVRRILGQPTTC